MRVLLLNLGSDLLDAVNQALRGQGYDVRAEQCLSADQALAHSPEVLVSDLTGSNCAHSSLIAELKAVAEGEFSPKVVIDLLERFWPRSAQRDASITGGNRALG